MNALEPNFASPNDSGLPNEWDVIVIGAGPAGSLTARQLALAGKEVLLLDAKTFPRDKVCGGYLNPRAVRVLESLDLLTTVAGENCSVTREIELIASGQRARFSLPPGRVIGRPAFDLALVRLAQAAGVTVMTSAQAVVEPSQHYASRTVTVTHNNTRHAYRARIVICADGLARTSIRHLSEFPVDTVPDTRVGIGAIVNDDSGRWPAADITMVVARHGYVGISRINDSQLNVAAAVEPTALSHSSPAEIAAQVFTDAGVPLPKNLQSAAWRGTPPLTSNPRHVAAQRVFLVGDAAGYVEPFTGEGMSAAFESAMAITPIVTQAVHDWAPACGQQWQETHRRIIRNRGTTCRKLAWVLRRPWATSLAMTACRTMPAIAARVIANTTQSLPACSMKVAGIL